LEEINQMMINLRENPLKEINGRVIIVEDYQSSMAKNLLDDSEIKWPKSKC
jgi:hypothetical protein